MKYLNYLLALDQVYGLGPVRTKLLLEYFGDPKKIWEADKKELLSLKIPQGTVENLENLRKSLDPEKCLRDLEKAGIKFLTVFDSEYPQRLKEIYDPPIIIYFKGEFKKEDSQALGVVGSRKVSGYGRVVTEKLTKDLSYSGLTIVSGLAKGVDSIAHKAALEVKGRTIAVLGGGLNKIYPKENIRLAREIWERNGIVMTEYPPDQNPIPANFPARNRIISGLSLGIVITEAAQDSGSLITAKFALDQGREVFAVPGPINSILSEGPSALIKNGAKLVTEAKDILEELGIEEQKLDKGRQVSLSQEEEDILECLSQGVMHIDMVCRELSQSASNVSTILMKMELNGLVKNLGSGNYVRTS